MPVTQHRFHYVGSSPINFVDPSGEMLLAGQMIGSDVLGDVWGTINSFALSIGRNLIARTIVKSAVAFGSGALTVVMAQKLASSYAENGIAKDELEMRANEYQKTLGVPPSSGANGVVYHYTNEENALSIYGSGMMKATRPKGSWKVPEGCYATDIMPWDFTYTQKSLSALFYGGNENADVTHFVALKNRGEWRSLAFHGKPREWVKDWPADTYAEVEPIMMGTNLMLKGH